MCMGSYGILTGFLGISGLLWALGWLLGLTAGKLLVIWINQRRLDSNNY